MRSHPQVMRRAATAHAHQDERLPFIPLRQTFRFEAAWLNHEGFKDFIQSKWNLQNPFLDNSSTLAASLPGWNKNIFGHLHLHYRKKNIMARLKGIQVASSYDINPFLDDLEKNLGKELQEVLDQEATFWLQKYGANWIKDGDCDTRYYHTETIIRRRRNKILCLRNSEGDWIFETEHLKNLAKEHFQSLFWDGNLIRPNIPTNAFFPPIEASLLNKLASPFSENEIKNAIFKIDPLTWRIWFPSYFFYHKNGNVVSPSIFQFIVQCWHNYDMIKNINKTLLVMVPKINPPEFISQIRPIALCNVIYKCITKIIVDLI